MSTLVGNVEPFTDAYLDTRLDSSPHRDAGLAPPLTPAPIAVAARMRTLVA